LRDTLFLLIDKHDDSSKFSDYFTEISKEENKSILKSCFDSPFENEGRISITSFITLLVNDRITIKDFTTRTGIEDSEEITLTELAVIVLHDLLTQRLISE